MKTAEVGDVKAKGQNLHVVAEKSLIDGAYKI